MKFYEKQGSYSYKDINHIKQRLVLISNADRFTCGGWTSSIKYLYDNKIEYSVDKSFNRYNNEYMLIYLRYLNNKEKRLSLDDILHGMIDRKASDWIKIKKVYLIKLGFYKVHDEYADCYY